MIKNKPKITKIKEKIFKEQGIKNTNSWNHSLIDKLIDELIKAREADRLKK